MPYHGSGVLHLSHMCFVWGCPIAFENISLFTTSKGVFQICPNVWVEKGKTCYGSSFGGQVSEMSPTISLNIGVIFAALL